MEKRTILAIVLCIGVWLLWQALFIEPPPPPSTDGGAQATGEIQTPDGGMEVAAQKEATAEPPAERPEEKLAILETELYRAAFTSRGAALKSMKLKKYRERSDEKGLLDQPEELVSVSEEQLLPLRLEVGGDEKLSAAMQYSDWNLESSDGKEVVFSWSDENNIIFTKRYRKTSIPYLLELEVEVTNSSETSRQLQLMLQLGAKFSPPMSSGCFGARTQPTSAACLANDSLERVNSKPGQSLVLEPAVSWTGIDEQYFLLAAVPMAVDKAVCRLRASQQLSLTAKLVTPNEQLSPGAQTRRSYRVFAGPKQLRLLQQVNGGTGSPEKPAGLDKAVDFGWLSFLCYPMLWALKTFHGWVGNWGVAIIFLTILVKLLLLPLTNKSMKSMKDMAKLKPLMEELKKKYGDDKQRLNQEMMNLYKVHKINPLGGCFPMLLQMPIWIALYRMLFSSVELYQTPFIPGWIEDLSWRDPYFIMPIVLGLTMFLQQKLTPTTADSQQAKIMMYVMPLFFTFIMLYLPSGLVLYIFVNSLLSIGHQMLYNRASGARAANTTGGS